MLPYPKQVLGRKPPLLLILSFLLGHSVFAQNIPNIRFDSVSRSEFGNYLEVDYSIDQAGVFEVEYSEDLVEWQLWTFRLFKISNESGGSGGFLFPMSSTGSRFLRMKPRDDTVQRAELAANRSKWEEQEIRSYEYETYETCYCDSDIMRTVRVSVKDGIIDSVVVARTGEVLGTAGYDTIDGQFERVEEAIDLPADFVTVRYDPIYGYPVLAEFDWSTGIADEERGFRSKLLHYLEFSNETGARVGEDAFSVSGIEIVGTLLQADVRFSGGCSLHAFSLSMDPDGFMESNPVQLDVFLRHDDRGDSCDSIVQERIEFDLSAVRTLYEEQGPIQLNIHSVIEGASEEEASVLLEI